jgi:hypothetical protein
MALANHLVVASISGSGNHGVGSAVTPQPSREMVGRKRVWSNELVLVVSS